MAKKVEKTEKQAVILDMNTPMEVALKHFQAGEITMDQFNEWDAAVKRALAAKGGKAKAAAAKKENSCEITRAEFLTHAKPITLIIGDETIQLNVKRFQAGDNDSGSFGWFFSGKVPVKVGKQEVRVQFGINATVVNSKHQAE